MYFSGQYFFLQSHDIREGSAKKFFEKVEKLIPPPLIRSLSTTLFMWKLLKNIYLVLQKVFCSGLRWSGSIWLSCDCHLRCPANLDFNLHFDGPILQPPSYKKLAAAAKKRTHLSLFICFDCNNND